MLFRTLIILFVAQFFFANHLLCQDFYKSGIQDIKLELPGSDWAATLDSVKRANPEARLAGSAWLNGERFDSVGIRYKGNSSYFRTSKQTLKKLPFNIKIDYKKKTQHFGEMYSSVKLSNAFLDPSFIRDPLSYEIVRTYMPASACNFARLTINNEPFGLYTNTESVDAAFLKKHFGYTGGYIVKCDPDQWQKVRSQSGCPKGENASLSYLNDSPGCYSAFYEVDDAAAWKPLLNLIKILNKKPSDIESVLDVDQTLWMLALNNVMVNLDSYNGSLSHNYYLWFDSVNIAHPIIWDLNMSFGGWRRNLSFEEMSDEELITFQPLAEINNARRPLISKLLKDSYYRKIYLAHVKTITDEWFVSGKFNTRVEQLMREIDREVQQDKQKLYSYDDFKNSVNKTMTDGADHIIGLRELMDKRAEYLSKHPLLTKKQPEISQPSCTVKGDKALLTAHFADAESGYGYYRADKMLSFTRVPLYDDGTHGDVTANDGVFSAEVNAAVAKHYYFAAENKEAAITLPARSSYEFFSVK